MKFKDNKKNLSSGGRKTKYPSNFRIIPVPLMVSFSKIIHAEFFKLYRGSLKIFILFIFIIAVVIVSNDLQKNLKTKQNIDSQRKVLTKELKFWESFIQEHEDYRDAYFQASILEYKLGNISKAKMYIEKGLSLDPNSKDGRKIEELLNK